MSRKNLLIGLAFLLINAQSIASTCPDLAQAADCVGLRSGGSCEGWSVQLGTITAQSHFFQVLTRSAFPFVVTCQYDGGALALIQVTQAIPTTPYLWSSRYLFGLSFDTCVSSLQNCSFTLAG